MQADGWDSEPFVLTERDGKLYGRGSTDDKGPVLDWLNAIEAYHDLGQDIPINIKVTFLQIKYINVIFYLSFIILFQFCFEGKILKT